MISLQIVTEQLDSLLDIWAAQLAATPQNPCWHEEGDVLNHTKMVCSELKNLPAFQKEPDSMQEVLYCAALIHDLGKIHATRLEDGRWVSPGHARIGAAMARQVLWQQLGLCGTPEKQRKRETICNLIRYHSTPPHAIDHAEPERVLRQLAANGHLLPDWNLTRLCLLAEADIRGRHCADKQALLEKVCLCRELAAETGCESGPYEFPTEHTAFAYLSGRKISPEYPLYDDTWGEVILLSGLPGTGKDTWIQENRPDIPMVSLDALRAEMGISPLDGQAPVVEAGRERARELLRKKQSFVWNATNLTPQIRGQQVALFTQYGARVRIVYLETDWAEQLRRNAGRETAVPEPVIGKMLEKLSPPEGKEAHCVQWICV